MSAVAPATMRDQLRYAIATLEAIGGGPAERIARGEAYFRLAVQPDTEVEEAIALLKTAEACDPFHPKIPFHLGRLHHQNGDPQGAVFEYRRALRLAPRSHRTFVHLALALEELTDQEQSLAVDMLAAVAGGDHARLRQLTVKLDAIVEAKLRRDNKPAAEPAPTGAGGEAATGRSGWKGLWQLLLVNELARDSPKRRVTERQLDEGRAAIHDGDGVGEYALACLFLGLDNPKLCRVVEERLREPALAARADHPAVRVLAHVCALGGDTTAEEFVARASRHVVAGELPAELVCCLHYTWHGVSESDPARALALLAGYHDAIQSLACFKELRIGILDHNAQRAWMADRLERAEILWQEALHDDPCRVTLAHNLALVATRQKAADKYEAAWERAAEAQYLLAAAAGDSRIELDDRIKLHRSFARQCQIRYAVESAERRGKSTEDLPGWLADADALTTWLREWELYYLNARLRFHSPVHLLGVTHDCSDDDIEAARQNLFLQLELGCGTRLWAGKRVFIDIVQSLVTHACAQATDPIARKRDPYFETERADSDALSTEAIERGLMLIKMLGAARAASSAAIRLSGYKVGRALLLIPWRSLEPLCKKSGFIANDDNVVEVCTSYFYALMGNDLSGDGPIADGAAKLAMVDDCVQALPGSVDLRRWRCRLLLRLERFADAYQGALDALPMTETLQDREKAAELAGELVGCVDNAAMAAFPGTRTRLDLATAIEQGLKTLAAYPRGARLRQLLASLLMQRAETEPARLVEAITLLEQGLDLVLTDAQLQELQRLLEKAGRRSRAGDAVARIRALVGSASERTRRAMELVRGEPSPAQQREARDEISEAIHEAQQAEAIAAEAELPAWVEKARQTVADLRSVLQGL